MVGVIIAAVAGALGAVYYMQHHGGQSSGSIISTSSETAEARIGRLIREASGQQPIKEEGSGKEREFDDAFREQYRNMYRANQEYIAAVRKIDTSAFSKLGSPESFADPSSFADGLRQIHVLYDLDMGQEQKVGEIVGNMRHIFETASWAASDRDNAMRQFEAGIAEPLAKRRGTVTAEQSWVQSIDDVYDYAQRNHSVFSLSGGQLVISDNSVLQEFNSKVQDMNGRRTAFMQAKQQYDQYQQELFRKSGVTSKDVGIQ